jgi:hypothetical protein
MTGSHPYPEDLIARARRGELPEEEQRALRRVLAGSREARMLYDVGLGFDAESPVLSGDEELLARLAERIGPLQSKRRAAPWWRIVLPAAAAGSFIAATAAASGWILLRPRPPAAPAVSSEPGRASAVRPPSRHHISASVRPSSAESAAAPSVASNTPTRGTARFASRDPNRSSMFLPPTEAAAREVPPTLERPDVLFARANRARRAGQTAEAMALYQRLASEHAATAEAQQAELSLGELYLRGGAPSAALEHFLRYGGQPLRAEALWGQARALRQLGSAAQEREVLLTLCEQLPTSPYAEPARKRLGTLAE